MKPLETLLYVLSAGGALAAYLLLAPPLSWYAIATCGAFLVWSIFAQDNEKPVLRLAGLTWSLEDFVRGWLITGRTGSSKTLSAINTITFQVFQNVPGWGGLCLDQKGLYWEILVKMAGHFGREGDLVLLQTRPADKDALWRPPNTINITGKPAEQRADNNLIILFADEGQEIITGAESAFADHRAAGVIREAKATMVLATQAYTSIHGALDKRYADVLMLNLSNEIIFTCANDDSAIMASKNIGEREVVEKSWGTAAGRMSYNYRRVIKPFYPPHKLRKLPKFTAIVRHCEKPFRKRLIPPLNPDGTFPGWFRDRGFELTVSEDAFEFLVRRGIHKTLGARPMRRTAQKFLGDAVRQALKSGASPSGSLTVSPLADHLAIET